MHFECDKHVNPAALMKSWRELNESRGVEYHEGCAVTGFRTEPGRIAGLETNQGDMDADAVVLATGALGPRLARKLGIRLHIQPGKGYSITTTRPETCPAIPMIFHDHRVGVTPLSDSYRLGSTMEFSGYDTRLNRKRIELLERGAAHYLHQPRGETTLDEWYGWRPMMADGIPRIGPGGSFKNLVVAAGHSMLGTSMGPATGKLVAELLSGTEPHIDATPYQL